MTSKILFIVFYHKIHPLLLLFFLLLFFFYFSHFAPSSPFFPWNRLVLYPPLFLGRDSMRDEDLWNTEKIFLSSC